MNVIEVNSVDDIDHPPPDKVQEFSSRVLDYLDCSNWELSVLFCSDDYIRQLNKRYLNHDRPTDILSFPQNDTDGMQNGTRERMFYAGDIVISTERVRDNAAEYNVDYEEEVKRLLIHGILHLKGMEHTYTNMEDQEMITLQENILKTIQGVSLS